MKTFTSLEANQTITVLSFHPILLVNHVVAYLMDVWEFSLDPLSVSILFPRAPIGNVTLENQSTPLDFSFPGSRADMAAWYEADYPAQIRIYGGLGCGIHYNATTLCGKQ